MKILRLTLYIGPTNEAYNQFTLPELSRHHVTMCTVFPGELRPDPRLDYHEGNGRIGRFLVRLWQLLRRQPPDVVHIHSPHLGVMFLIAAVLASPSLLRRTVLHIHSSYSVYRFRNRWMLLPGFLLFGRVVCCSHASRASFPTWWRRLAGRRLRTIRNAVDLQRVDAARIKSVELSTSLQGPHRAVGARRASVADMHLGDAVNGFGFSPALENSLDGAATARNRKVERVGAPPGGCGQRDACRSFQLVTVGHLRPLKNQISVVRALAQTSIGSTQLTIVGGGRMLELLRDEAERLGVADRVVFTGQISRDATLSRLWTADVFVSMSRGEGLPVAVLEAMSCHCPVILSRIPPHVELAGTARGRVLLVDADDVPQLATHIDRLVSLAPDCRAAWGKACRRAVEQSFSLQRLHRQCEQLFQQLVPDHHADRQAA